MKNTNRILNKIISATLALVMILGLSVQANAKIYNSFRTEAVIPNNQINKKVQYFDLKVNSKTKQELFLNVSNSGSEDMYAHISLNNATTGNDGTLLYSANSNRDKSLNKGLSDLASIKNPKLLVPANSTKKAIIKLDMQKYEFDGTILGGINVTATTTVTDNKEDKEDGVVTNNEISFVTAMKLTMNNKAVATNLNLIETKANVVNYKTAITANIQNDKPVLMKDATITGEIYEKDSKEAISSVKLDKVDIAPNSNFNVVYDWNNNALKDGEYRIRMEAKHDKRSWKWDETFTVKQAKEVNKQAFKVKTDYKTYIMIGIIILLLLGIIILIIIKRRKK